MGDLYKAKFSDERIYIIEIQRMGISDYRARILTSDGATSCEHLCLEAKNADPEHWLQLHSETCRTDAMKAAVEALTHNYPGYLCEVAYVAEAFRSELAELLGTALETVAGLEARVETATCSALQSAEHADSYKRQLTRAREELAVATQLAVRLHDQKDAVEAFVVQAVKGEA